MLLSGLLTVAFASIAIAAHVPVDRVVHKSRRSLPSGWSPIRRANHKTIIPLRVGLVQSNLDRLEQYLLEVAHPDSPRYSEHWTPAQVADVFRPSADAVDTVRTWLFQDGGIDPRRIVLSKSGGWLSANVTVEEAETLLGTEYHVYEHDDGREHVACKGGYLLPQHVSRHVDLITPTIEFDVKIRRHGLVDRDSRTIAKNVGTVGFGASPKMGGPVEKLFTATEHCDITITLACLRMLYGFVYTPVMSQRNSIGVVEYSPQTHNPSDFDVFFGNYSKSQVDERPTLVSVDGGSIVPTHDVNALTESNLDLQYVLGLLGKKQDVLLYQVGDGVAFSSFNDLLDGFDDVYCTFDGGDDPTQDGAYPNKQPGGFKGQKDCGGIQTASVISTSYGYQEAELTPAYMQRQCAEYGKLSLMGMTFVYSSGDSGVAAYGDICLDDSGQEVSNGSRFNPTFPSGCPYVTSVGATQVVPGNKATHRESAVFQLFQSGGGFSNVFSRPTFQASAVDSYLKNHPPGYAPGIFNDTGRAFPDVSANGLNYSVAVNGVLRLVSGTSASTPTFASILAAINDARLADGKKSLGWINPAIYSESFVGAFNDIVSGTNPGCGTDGFAATSGWDPVTGLGTPNFAKLLSRFLHLP